MAPASLVLLAWSLFTVMMVTAAVQLEPEEEELNDTVICTNDHMEVVIPSAFFLNKVPPVYVEDLHLNDPECRGVEVGDDYVFSIKTNLSDCGTIMKAKLTRLFSGEGNAAALHLAGFNEGPRASRSGSDELLLKERNATAARLAFTL
ncbi:hypothetical protein EYF80_011518 [Liparis tanakae]|uniref:ZP-N domain-containing protein n=1 Tax=Liparis tanakae TaxID=230148 RepID=A0A4Z2IKJ2_9TELE|nr:hypothetical protein EYF80_011518 [Liparis tanakae]